MVKNMTEKTVKGKISELISVFGVGSIGFGLGALFADFARLYAPWIILIGILMHGLGMYEIQTMNKKEMWWTKPLYWLCWIIIIGLAIYVLPKLL